MFNNAKKFKGLSIDFTKPWWQLIVQQKWQFLSILLVVTLTQVFWSLVPFIAAQLFEAQSFFLCIVVFAVWLCIDVCFSIIRVKVNTHFQLQCIHSIYHNAYCHLLTIDPHYHIHRSSGAVVAKIERGARGYEDLLDYISFELIPLIMGLVTVIVTLAYYSVLLAVVITGFISAILIISYYFSHYICPAWEQEKLKNDDNFKATAMENLTQIALIRSTFASNFRRETLQKSIQDNIVTESSLWLFYGYLFTGLSALYNLSLFVLAALLLWYIQVGMVTITTALGLFLIYVQSSRELIRFGRLLRKIMHSKAAIKDLFAFIPTFGKQSFPVLGQADGTISKGEMISIVANNIYFDYGNAILFNDHTFKLISSKTQHLKLYGIIGLSGSGKTTLLSIFGGQLKPVSGTVLINDIDIYRVNDAARSQLIALQGQIASNIRGTVKSNLLLGLPSNHNYTDSDLLKVLEQVGLLSTLNRYNSLETLLGESGLNLSGGQRQRLNFASLYLRAYYYKPLLVLIDEPTSSLDEISELAITDMINQLAQHSVTFVIAHRLKTIHKAVGIIDLSLLQQEKVIKVYEPASLQEHSNYYKELIQGTIQLDS